MYLDTQYGYTYHLGIVFKTVRRYEDAIKALNNVTAALFYTDSVGQHDATPYKEI